jgi:toxin ParE1/3/4
MKRAILTNKAVEDLASIWTYTYNKWSEKQADEYYYTLIATCNWLAENPCVGKPYAIIKEGLYGYKSGHHLIFYRVADEDTIEVIRFLHEMMDVRSRLR